MQLSQLEIKGFKSFADKVLINFDEGITGVVGPNGCGKSNIVDAIRWVLGEQKTSALRSEKMENIIFNGSAQRSPQQMAEVSLTVNNTKNLLPTEYSQVTITRRLYRSGDSEYLLNGVQCRLKDITNLFLDTGVASNSYAIIELGMVDDLLNDKDHSRRMLFEEAAGISKFKKRKKETLKKLEDTDADLERVEDLLFEIEKNMKSLEKQAKQTENYFKIKEEYKEKSIQLAKAIVSRQKEKHGALTARMQAEGDRKIQLTAQVAEAEAGIESSKTGLIEHEKTLSGRQRGINDLVNTIRQSESDKQIRNERAKHLGERSTSLTEQIENDGRSNERTTFALQGLENEKLTALTALEQTRARAEALKAEYEQQRNITAVLQTEADAQRMQQRLHHEVVFQLNKDAEIREIQITSFRQELERTTSDSHHQSASLEEFEKKLQLLHQEITRRNAALDLLKNEEADTQERIHGLEKTIELIREEMTDAGRKLDARQNEYNLTKSLVENLEGFPEAIKFLKRKVGWTRNAPLLSDIITTSEEFRVPIENYLEPYLNYYVVEHEAEAYEAINILSDASKGKANFFILDAFERFEPSAVSIYPNAYPATQIVEFDPKYRKLMSYILDKVYVVESDIKSIAADDDNTFLTKSGKYTRRRFSLSGGSVGLFEGKKIGRARNLEKLDKEIRQLTRKLDEVRQSLLDRQRELDRMRNNDIRHRLEGVQNELRMVNEEYVSVKTKQEQFSDMLSTAGVRKEDILEKITQLDAELNELRPRAQRERDVLNSMDVKLTALGADLKAHSELLTIRAGTFNEQNLLVHQQESRVSSLDQELRFKQEALELGNQRTTSNTEELGKAQEEIKSIAAGNQNTDTELAVMYGHKDEMERGLNEAEREYYAARGQIDQAEKDLRELQHSRENVDALLMELQHQMGERQLELNSIKERLSVEFRIDPDEILRGSEMPDVTDEQENELKEDVLRMREKLDNFGPINPMAMEAYTEIKERNDFIVTQKEDLIRAKESLFSTIAEIENVASLTFMDAFMKIREHFIHVFRQLFNEGDDCDLKLVDAKNPLESEIDIIAKPKGKRPISINQLSGGEKTLTATALLFSMYLLKPAPFCIFDEVDAPLDDANIDKFNTIVRTFSKDSQFVIVTHNKRTMTSTDVIYGITMVEKGISRVVAVDLRELA